MTIIVGRVFDPGAIYIGRAMPRMRLRASPLANPFSLKHFRREEALRQYQIWFDHQMTIAGPARAEVMRLIELARHGDITLGCWCSPQPCHGDIIRAYMIGQFPGGAS